MSWASSEVVSILIFLLPGLVAAAIFGSLTSHPKPSDFDRVFQSLIFTIVVQAITAGLLWCFVRKDLLTFFENGHVEIFLSVVIAIVLGILVSYMFNHDWLHRFLRIARATKENAYPSEWYSTFFNYSDSYVVLHLDGERRLYGWPEEWPSQPGKGHFRIAEAEWLEGENRIPLEGVDVIVVPATEVGMVEFMEPDFTGSEEA